MKYSDIEKHLIFGHNLVSLRFELIAYELKPHEYSYPERKSNACYQSSRIDTKYGLIRLHLI